MTHDDETPPYRKIARDFTALRVDDNEASPPFVELTSDAGKG
jgi:hypothetical protein